MTKLPPVSIVVIGRNEERNLQAAFAAVRGMDYPKDLLEIIYVDSNSRDDSIGIARKYADVIISEKHSLPSAARGRNVGLVSASHDIVHFIDGDMQIDPGYLKKAVAVLTDPKIHAVSGYIYEKNDHAWNRIMSSVWSKPQDGYSTATAAGGTYKKAPLLQVNGYDERVVLGEESELGERFRENGFFIWSMNQPMGIHHYAMNGVGDYIKWCIKNGRVRTRTLALSGHSRYFQQNKRLARSNTLINLVFLLTLGVFIGMNKLIYLIYAILFYLLLLLLKYLLIKKIRNLRQLLFYLIMNIARPFSYYGQCRERLKLIFNKKYRETVLVEKMILK